MRPLLESTDVVVEQFRPGVMDRLGLGYAALKQINPRIVYCAITGFGQEGPKAQIAAHDLNYQAAAGLLSISAGSDGAPVVPSALIADIAGGAYPAVMNILLALLRRQHSGEGCRLDVSMTDGLFPFLYGAIGTAAATDAWPRPAGELLSGGSPRYQLYPTRDGRYLAVAPLEEKFWQNFCEAIELPAAAREDRKDPAATIRAVRTIISQRTASEWISQLAGKDVCVNVVGSLQEAMEDPQFRDRGLFRRSEVSGNDDALPAVSVPICEPLRDPRTELRYPQLGEANKLLGNP